MQPSVAAEGACTLDGPVPRSPGCPKASQGWRWRLICPTLLPLCLVCAPPRLLSFTVAPWRFWKFSGYLLVLSHASFFPFSLSGPPWGGPAFSERCLFSMTGTASLLSCLSAAQPKYLLSRPVLLFSTASLSFNPLPLLSLLARCRLSSRLSRGPGAHWPLWAWWSCPRLHLHSPAQHPQGQVA